MKYDYRKQQNNGVLSGTVIPTSENFKFSVEDNEAFLPVNLSDPPSQIESEFSNSPKFLPDTQSIENIQNYLTENESCEAVQMTQEQFLSNNSNFYSAEIRPADVPKDLPPLQYNYIFYSGNDSKSSTNENNNNNNRSFGGDSLLYLDEKETELPFKKRRTVINPFKEISYPAQRMVSMGDLIDLFKSARIDLEKITMEFKKKGIDLEKAGIHLKKNGIDLEKTGIDLEKTNPRLFKTPAERKQMPPNPADTTPKSDSNTIVTDQFNFNNNTFNNTTINYYPDFVPLSIMPVCSQQPYSYSYQPKQTSKKTTKKSKSKRRCN